MRSRIGKFVASVALCATCAFSGENAPAKQQDAPALDLLKASADSIAKVDAHLPLCCNSHNCSIPLVEPELRHFCCKNPFSFLVFLKIGNAIKAFWLLFYILQILVFGIDVCLPLGCLQIKT